jgi:cytochrome c2
MKKEHFLQIIAILQFVMFTLSFHAYSQVVEGEPLFKLNCSPCHTVGKGKLIGPDLINIETRRDAEWIKQFIRSSQTLIQNGDPTALAVYNENGQILMPDQPALSGEQVEAILAYIRRTRQALQPQVTVHPGPVQDQSYGQEVITDPATFPPDEIQDEQVLKGRELFLGLVQLKAGGPSCNSCHNVTEEKQPEGGVFAPDLTNVYSRIDEKEIMELATAPRYPSMQRVYKDKPILQEEARLIAAFLKYAGTSSSYQQQRDQKAAELLKRFQK